MPLVVTSTLYNGVRPRPIRSLIRSYGPRPIPAFWRLDPHHQLFLRHKRRPTCPRRTTNALKAAWVQFLTLRHGGSGYLFGFGNGSRGL